MKAREIMTREPLFVLESDPVWRAAEMMRYHDVGCTPVVADEHSRRLVGILTDRDIAVRCMARKHAPECRVRDHMTGTPIHTVQMDDDVRLVLRKMEQLAVRRIPVVTSDGALIGLISNGDILRRLGPREPILVEKSLERTYAHSHAMR